MVANIVRAEGRPVVWHDFEMVVDEVSAAA
jgi:hypothetical protein